MSDSGDIVQLDDLALMMLEHLKANLAEEPPLPKENMPAPMQDEAARDHLHWASHRDAIRLLLQHKLLRLAEAQLL